MRCGEIRDNLQQKLPRNYQQTITELKAPHLDPGRDVLRDLDEHPLAVVFSVNLGRAAQESRQQEGVAPNR